jgi:hypothetical protein
LALEVRLSEALLTIHAHNLVRIPEDLLSNNNAQLEDNMTDTKAAITDPEEFLKLSEEQLDDLFRNAPAGAIPIGQGDGTAIIGPGTVVSDTIAKYVHL